MTKTFFIVFFILNLGFNLILGLSLASYVDSRIPDNSSFESQIESDLYDMQSDIDDIRSTVNNIWLDI